MAANSLAVSYTDIQSEVALEMGWDRNPQNWSVDQNSDFALVLKAGLNSFYYPPPLPGENKSHVWGFLKPLLEIELTPGYATGTVTIVPGASGSVVTGTATVFPSWADQGDLWVSEGRYTVKSKTSGTEIILDDVAVTVSSETSYTLRRHYYDLPDDWGGIFSNGFTYRRDHQWHLPAIKVVGEAQIREVDREYSIDVYPNRVALVPTIPTTSQSSRWQAWFYPLAQQTYKVEARYFAIPPLLDGITNIYPYGGAEHGESVVAAIIDAAYRRIHSSEEKNPHFLERIRQSVLHDRRNYQVETLGLGVWSEGRSLDGLNLNEQRRKQPYSDLNVSFGV